MSSINVDQYITEKIFGNSIIFLNLTIDEIINPNFDINNTNDITKVCVMIQTAVELAMKYAIAYNAGQYNIKGILEQKYTNLNDMELYDSFLNNELKVREFEQLKNCIKSRGNYQFSKNEELKYLSKFQNYRNKILHLNYNFSEEELNNIKGDFIYIIINIVIPLLYEGHSKESIENLSPNDFLKIYVGSEKYIKLYSIIEYKNVVKNLAQKLKEKLKSNVVSCPRCSEHSWLVVLQKCILCGYENNGFDYLNCIKCDNKTVGYDENNIEYNNNKLIGNCFNCNQKYAVVKCEDCGNINYYIGELSHVEQIGILVKNKICEYCNLTKENRIPPSYVYTSVAFSISESIKNNKITVLNPRKNVIKIAGKKAQEYFQNSYGNEKFKDSILESVEYLAQAELIDALVDKNEIICTAYNFINQNYVNGSDEESQKIHKQLFISQFGKEADEELNRILMDSVMVRRSGDLTEEEFSIVYKCREYLNVDNRLFFNIYSRKKDLILPSDL